LNKVYNIFLFFNLGLFLISCNSLEVDNSSFSRIEVIGPDEVNIYNHINIYKDSIDYKLDNVIGYSDELYTKADFTNIKFNSSLGNLIADIIFIQSDSVFKEQENKQIDFVLQNHGGIRSSLLKGEVKLTDIYKILPFENEIVILEISGATVEEIISFLKNEINPHPVSGISIRNDESLIQNKIIDSSKKYYLATNDYLLNGGDNMFFLNKHIQVYKLGYSLRDAFIDYTKTNLKLTSKVDDRFLKDE
jgi:2',3'-cyclic-nucleotide 2'-phosphodiesterase (5'-nucleotidase family)